VNVVVYYDDKIVGVNTHSLLTLHHHRAWNLAVNS